MKYNRIRFLHFLTLVALLLFPFSGMAFDIASYSSSSVLSQGKWVKVSVSETGVYKITQSDISRWGFSKIDDIRIFGYGGKPISDVLSKSNYIDDLPQVPVLRSGNTIYFYAQSVDSHAYYNGTQVAWRQIQHPYATEAFYFITEDSSKEDITWQEATTIDAADSADSFVDFAFHERELYSPGQTGRRLYGEDFKYSTSQTFKFSLTDIVDNSDVSVLTAFGAKVVGSSSSISMQYNGQALETSASDLISAISSLSYDHMIYISSAKRFKLSDKDLSWTINYKYSGTLYDARLDYITVNYTRSLKLNSGKLAFRFNSPKRMSISGASAETVILDVTNHIPVQIKGNLSADIIEFLPTEYGVREYYAFNPSTSLPSPTFKGSITNQNLHSEETPDMLIISPSEFLSQAQRIASLHTAIDDMHVLVTTPEKIYNEFSSGTADINAFRKICKMFYDRSTSDGSGKFKYLLLFGRGHYDNRQLAANSKSYVKYPILPVWESETSENESSSFNTDDILGFLEDNSGANLPTDKLSIGIGRMPVKSVTEARNMVDKLYRYVNESRHGSWKNNVLMIADDEDDAIHMKQSENIIATMKANGGENYVYNHVYTDAFQAISNGRGRSYPDARDKMFRQFSNGNLWVNYVGHANPVSWTHDGLLSMTDIENNFFYNNLPLLYTATCEFTRWDADEVSGGELLFLNTRGGAISLISTSRVAYISDNGVLNNYIAKYVFARDENGNHLRLGDIIKNGKNSYSGSNENKLRYMLIGDPAMRLKYPESNVVLETIDGSTVSSENMPEIKARSTAKITGRITDINGNVLEDFNGSLRTTLYDAESSVTTYGHGDNGTEYLYYDRNTILYIGQDSIKNGRFDISIKMPTEISNNYSPAMLNFYAVDDKDNEANGMSENLYVYGCDDNVSEDTDGPNIKYCYLNNDNFKNGDNVNESPMLIAAFDDASGINISNVGIGHQMSVTIDGTKQFTDVSQYYTPDAGNSSGGTIAYPLSGLSEGSHTLKFKVWDNLNNSSDTTITFNVIEGLAPEMYDVYTTSSPASVEANFYIKHNRPDAMITVRLSVYNLMGREIWSVTQTGKSDMFTSFPITWNLCDYASRRVNRGIYIYKASISTDGIQETTKSKKIAVAAEQ